MDMYLLLAISVLMTGIAIFICLSITHHKDELEDFHGQEFTWIDALVDLLMSTTGMVIVVLLAVLSGGMLVIGFSVLMRFLG